MQKRSKKLDKAEFINFEKNVKLIDQQKIKKLISKTLKLKTNTRYCLHAKSGDKQQEMVVCQRKKNFFPPKKNLLSDQTFLIIKGKLLIIIFNDKGRIIKKTILSKDGVIYARVKKKIYHCDIPLSKVTIHLETKNCIFKKKINKFADFNYNLKDLLKHEVNKN